MVADSQDRKFFRDAFPCPYFADGRSATYEYIVDPEMSRTSFGKFLAHGFRRSGIVYYRTRCRSCRECLPLRIDVDTFVPNRSQRKILQENSDMRVVYAETPFMNQEKTDLYVRYIDSKHGKKSDRNSDEVLHQLVDLHYGYEGTIEVDYFLSDRLIGVGIVDAGDNGLSANYFYYDTNYLDRHPGIFSILKEIDIAKTLGMRFYYLGFYIEGTPKMSYKKSFRPNQALRNRTWAPFLA